MSKIDYWMTFEEVLHEIFDTKGWYQGEEFLNGVYITVDDDMLVGKQFSKRLDERYTWPLSITRGVVHMKYRRVYTQPEVERKC